MFLNMTKFIMLWLVFSLSVFGQVVQENDPQLQGIDVTEHLGESIPLDLQFV